MHRSLHRLHRRRRYIEAARGLLEPLEGRLLLAANLVLDNIRMVNASNVPLAGVFTVGDKMFFRGEYRTTDLTAVNTYIVRFNLDGVDLDSPTITGSAGVNFSTARFKGGWYATAGSHVMTVTVDALNAIAETNESDNSMVLNFSTVLPVDLPERFVMPLSGRQNEDWSLVNYLDVNPVAVTNNDYQGGIYTYDDHNGIDITMANFSGMDVGLPVVAAAAGTVTVAADGNFDRQTVQQVNAPANYIIVDHGNGWSTWYYHFSLNTTMVKTGDKVVAGQILGLAGSSGFSTLDHLHFEVQHNGVPVETFYAPTTFWQQPITYENSTAPRVLDSGTTNRAPTVTEVYEDASDVSVFPTAAGGSVYYWLEFSHYRPSDVITVFFIRPNLSTATSLTLTAPTTPARGPYYLVSLGVSSIAGTPGTWQLTTVINGVEADRKPFTITTGAGVPEIHLSQGTTYVIDGRTTPLDFGSIAQAGGAPQLSFTVLNHGSATLNITGSSLPPGFSLVGALPATLAANATGSFMIQMDTAVVGAKFGTVHLTTNDADEADFTFNVAGTVTGAVAVGRPTLGMSVPAVAYLPGAGQLVIDSGMTVTDSNSANFDTGNLTVELAGNGVTTDVLRILSTGTGAGQISVSGSNIGWGSSFIGTFTGGTNLVPLQITFNDKATLPAVQALLRAITYHNTTSQPDIRRRYVRFTLTDNTGLVSNLLMKTVAINVYPYGKYTPVVTRAFFYKGSSFDSGAGVPHDNAIAPFQTALLPGQLASSTHYSNYSRGINGVMVDVSGAGVMTSADFVLRVGNDNNPAAWALAVGATFTFRAGAGVGGSTRVEITFADNVIQNQWLQVTVLANANTKLKYDDVFYFGNVIGETKDSAGNTRVTSLDEIRARAHPGIVGAAALIDNVFDFNRDGVVDGLDQGIARLNVTAFGGGVLLLKLLPPNVAAPFVGPLVMGLAAGDGPVLSVASEEVLERRVVESRDASVAIVKPPVLRVVPLARFTTSESTENISRRGWLADSLEATKKRRVTARRAATKIVRDGM